MCKEKYNELPDTISVLQVTNSQFVCVSSTSCSFVVWYSGFWDSTCQTNTLLIRVSPSRANGNCVECFGAGMAGTVRTTICQLRERQKREGSRSGAGGVLDNPERAPTITKFNANTHHDGDALCRDYITTYSSIYCDDHRRGLYDERRGPRREGVWMLLHDAGGLHQ